MNKFLYQLLQLIFLYCQNLNYIPLSVIILYWIIIYISFLLVKIVHPYVKIFLLYFSFFSLFILVKFFIAEVKKLNLPKVWENMPTTSPFHTTRETKTLAKDCSARWISTLGSSYFTTSWTPFPLENNYQIDKNYFY